jgi:nicotinamide-nucleotide amidase
LKNVGSIRASNARGIPEERMKVELLSVGTELLLGEIVDTNAVYLAEKLSRLGINVFHKTTVGDNAERLAAALRISMGRSDVVLATGGLGPTEDDITAAAVAHVAGVDLVEDEATAERIRSFARQRGIGLLDKLLKQAHVPRGATVVPNPTGTAPGVIVTRDGKTVITLPGVPSEMKAMAEETVLPYLARRVASAGPGTILSRVLRLTGIGESQVEAEIADLIRNQGNPTIAPLARTFEVHLRLTARASDAAQARSMLAPLEAEIRQRVGEHIYGADDESLESVAGRMLREAGLTLAVAESCTGGLIGHRLTNVPGSSDYLLAVLVTYGNESKMKLLDVPRDTLEQHGAASAEAAGAMAEGVRATCGAAVGLAVTGIAGPTGARPGKPVGLVYAAVANGADTTAERHVLRGDRLTVKGRASQAALHLLYRSLGAMKAGQACQCTS